MEDDLSLAGNCELFYGGDDSDENVESGENREGI